MHVCVRIYEYNYVCIIVCTHVCIYVLHTSAMNNMYQKVISG